MGEYLCSTVAGEVSEVCHALALALADDPFYVAITAEARGPEQRHQMLVAYFELAYRESLGAGEVQLAPPYGAAFWLIQDRTPELSKALSDARKRGIQTLLGPMGFQCYNQICSFMECQLPEELCGAWYLSILGIRPEARGAGLAGQLLVPTLERADSAGGSSYLETFNPRSIPFYERYGFHTERYCFEPFTKRDYWIMVRQPK